MKKSEQYEAYIYAKRPRGDDIVSYPHFCRHMRNRDMFDYLDIAPKRQNKRTNELADERIRTHLENNTHVTFLQFYNRRKPVKVVEVQAPPIQPNRAHIIIEAVMLLVVLLLSFYIIYS